jgi:hypothetical protein
VDGAADIGAGGAGDGARGITAGGVQDGAGAVGIRIDADGGEVGVRDLKSAPAVQRPGQIVYSRRANWYRSWQKDRRTSGD